MGSTIHSNTMPPKLLDGTSLAFSLENPKRAGSKADAMTFWLVVRQWIRPSRICLNRMAKSTTRSQKSHIHPSPWDYLGLVWFVASVHQDTIKMISKWLFAGTGSWNVVECRGMGRGSGEAHDRFEHYKHAKTVAEAGTALHRIWLLINHVTGTCRKWVIVSRRLVMAGYIDLQKDYREWKRFVHFCIFLIIFA